MKIGAFFIGKTWVYGAFFLIFEREFTRYHSKVTWGVLTRVGNI